MKDLAQIMQQAQAMQAKMAEVQAKIEATEADGLAGAGLVRVKLKGKGELVSVTIDKSLMGDEGRPCRCQAPAGPGHGRRHARRDCRFRRPDAGLQAALLAA
jgi:hypothetical protein